MPGHFPPSSYPQGTSCKYWEKHSKTLCKKFGLCSACHTILSEGYTITYFFTGILPSLLVWRERRMYLRWKNTRGLMLLCTSLTLCYTFWNEFILCSLSIYELKCDAKRLHAVHSHFVQEDLSARIVPCSIVGNCKNVICPVLRCILITKKQTATSSKWTVFDME